MIIFSKLSLALALSIQESKWYWILFLSFFILKMWKEGRFFIDSNEWVYLTPSWRRPLSLCSANQWTGFYMIALLLNQVISVLKDISKLHYQFTSFECHNLFNRDFNRACLIYMFSLRFSVSKFLINLRRQFWFVNFFHEGSFVHKFLRDLQSFHFVFKTNISKMLNLCSRLLFH